MSIFPRLSAAQKNALAIALLKAVYPRPHPAIRFAEWVRKHNDDLHGACLSLGVVFSPDQLELPLSHDVYQRVKARIMPLLVDP